LLGLLDGSLSCDVDAADSEDADDGSLFDLAKIIPAELLADELEYLPSAFDSDLPDFCHPNDRSALAKMKSVPEFTKVMSVYAKHFSDRERHLEFMSNSLRVGPKQCPEIYAPIPEICSFFGIDTPEVYVANSSKVIAFASGATQHQLVVTTGLLDTVEPKELEATSVRECAHIFCKHMLYFSFGKALTSGILNATLGNLPVIRGVSNLATKALSSAYNLWSRCAELSADRAEALYYDDPDEVVMRFLRSAGGNSRYTKELNISAFREQGEEYLNEVSGSGVSKFYHMFDMADSAQRLYPIRTAELYHWIESEDYANIKPKYNTERFKVVA